MGDAGRVLMDWVAALDKAELDESLVFLAPDVEWSNPVASVRGPAEVRGLFGAFWAAIPEFEHSVTQLVEDGGLVALEGVASGTHLGRLAGPAGEIPASGRSVEFPFAAWARVENGLITRFRGYWDVAAFMQQIGAMPEPAAAHA